MRTIRLLSLANHGTRANSPARRLLRLRDIWAIWIRLQLTRKIRDLALFDLAIDSKLRACDLAKLASARCWLRRSHLFSHDHSSTKDSARSSSRSPRQPERRSPPGSNARSFDPTPTCFRAVSTIRPICRHGNTHESWISGSQESVWALLHTGRTRCVGQRLP